MKHAAEMGSVAMIIKIWVDAQTWRQQGDFISIFLSFDSK
jgi:hypothetical protein